MHTNENCKHTQENKRIQLYNKLADHMLSNIFTFLLPLLMQAKQGKRIDYDVW